MHSHSFTRRQVFSAAGLAGLAALPACSAGKSERLTITKIEVFQVVVPMQDDIINSPEFNPDPLSEFPKGPKVIVKLHTDSGLVGIGETSRNVPREGALENARHLEGQAVLDLNLPRLALPDGRSRAGFEIALYDVVGKAFGWPVYQLLGGLAQDRVYVPYWCGRKNPVDAKRVAERTLNGGFTSLKMKGRPEDPIAEAVRAVSEVAPDVQITVDFNRHYETAEEFLPIGRALDGIGSMRTIEDPVDDLGRAGQDRGSARYSHHSHASQPKAHRRGRPAGRLPVHQHWPAALDDELCHQRRAGGSLRHALLARLGSRARHQGRGLRAVVRGRRQLHAAKRHPVPSACR